MSNKPAPRCPGCGAAMKFASCIGACRYLCDCGWSSPTVFVYDPERTYDKAMKRYNPVYDGYQGTTHEQGWPDQRVQTLHGGGEVNFDMPPGKYPLVCESTRKDERSD